MALEKRAEGNQLPDNLSKVGREVDTCTVHMLRTSILSADQLYLNVSYLHVTSMIEEGLTKMSLFHYQKLCGLLSNK